MLCSNCDIFLSINKNDIRYRGTTVSYANKLPVQISLTNMTRSISRFVFEEKNVMFIITVVHEYWFLYTLYNNKHNRD